MRHPLNITLVDGTVIPEAMRARFADLMRFQYPERVPVAPAGAHPDLGRPGDDAAAYYWRNGYAAKKIRAGDGQVIYRLPWRYWRYRQWDTSGDWRLTTAGEPLELVGILLLAPNTIPKRPRP